MRVQVTINPMEAIDFKEAVQKKMANFIYHEDARDFNQYCQINRRVLSKLLALSFKL